MFFRYLRNNLKEILYTSAAEVTHADHLTTTRYASVFINIAVLHY